MFSTARTTFALLLTLVLVIPSFAFELPLTDHSVREAYFLGQHHDASTESALKPYLHTFPPPKLGAYISDIRLLTPYAQVIDISNSHSSGYSAQQAAADYHARGEIVIVRFHIRFTPTYSYIKSGNDRFDADTKQGIHVRSEDFWQDFKAGLSQDHGQWLQPLSRQGEPVYVETSEGGGIMDGAYIWLTFEAREVLSETVTAEIYTPDGQYVTSDFDLATLR
ncbi:MAG: hypothetical protein JSS69_03545 [Acidobacteria bacterium]|nr:hypothetical protein [Acidobacteriota bacterium]MBS1864968.1 hypothetical protein [Acidobacteriota bacterium]